MCGMHGTITSLALFNRPIYRKIPTPPMVCGSSFRLGSIRRGFPSDRDQTEVQEWPLRLEDDMICVHLPTEVFPHKPCSPREKPMPAREQRLTSSTEFTHSDLFSPLPHPSARNSPTKPSLPSPTVPTPNSCGCSPQGSREATLHQRIQEGGPTALPPLPPIGGPTPGSYPPPNPSKFGHGVREIGGGFRYTAEGAAGMEWAGNL